VRRVTVIEGGMVPLDRADVDTDQIMPKQFLKRIERTGFGEFVFADWRADPGFVLNDARYAGANVLVAGSNFGSGSSREHAPWGLQQYGFEAVVAPSFADIFRANCAKIGLLCVELPAAVCKRLVALAQAEPTTTITVDLPAQRVRAGAVDVTFAIDPFTKHLLVEGLDDIALTVQHDDAIVAYERQRPTWRPTTAAG
jgi:3-isopropylmalate/(R)-2-methylmalate dehydratase small subunit